MNRLAAETSPYLLQHAANPVHWYPWGDEALARARREHRPILLSIGYSACHWCHVMAHESFGDPATAALMNRLYVNVKVDREERPEIDRSYQLAHQLLARRPGGWPLTVLLHPDTLRPFFAGTYLPPEPRHGLPAFGELLERAARYFADHEAEILATGDALADAFARLDAATPAEDLDATPLAAARDALVGALDREHGGFGGAPKFPHAPGLERLLRHWRASAHGAEPDTEALFACALSMTRMAEGGVYDQLGGGFFRYATDAAWQVPHFEKMLYDNGPLLALAAELWLVSGDDLYRRVATETADWLLREMQLADGGFAAALDADAAAGEGAFYTWTPAELRRLLGAGESAVVEARFGLDSAPNFGDRWHLAVARSVADAAALAGVEPSAAQRCLDTARSKLLAARDGRERPARDDKVLAAWNALAVRGLAIAARALGRDDLVHAARRAVDFVRTAMIVDGRLRASWRAGQPGVPGFLDDHACLLDALLELLPARWDPAHLELARWLGEALLEHFEDRERGGFFFTARDREAPIRRARPLADEALPSGNAVAARALHRLGLVLGEPRYLDAAARAVRAGFAAMREFPLAHAGLLTALEEQLAPPSVVVIRGTAEACRDWAAALGAVYAPRRVVLPVPADAVALPGALAARAPGPGTRAYVCEGLRCGAPVDSLQALAAALSET